MLKAFEICSLFAKMLHLVAHFRQASAAGSAMEVLTGRPVIGL